MSYLPILDQPVQFHSSRDPGKCKLTPEQCAYKSQYWVFWYTPLVAVRTSGSDR